MMKTVPTHFTTDEAATYAASQLKQQRAQMAKKWGLQLQLQPQGAGGLQAGAPLGKNGSSLQQPPQPYAFCGQTFSRSRLSVLDLAHVSNAAYMDINEAREYISQEVAGASRFNLTLLEMDVDYGPITYLLDDVASRTLVFAIRGTNTVVREGES